MADNDKKYATVKYVIAIGGSGSKSLEALIHLCAVGLGPNELSIFFIDPDSSNGNLTRTRNLVSTYNECRESLDGIDIPLFKTKLNLATPRDTWQIFKNPNETLQNYIGYTSLPSSMQHLVDLLYTKQELSTDLSKGFRGHPNIGAMVMASPSFEEDPWRKFGNDIFGVNKEGDAQVFILGSIFGGTGASGFATIGYTIKNHEKIKISENRKKVNLGGALLLPYFSFDPIKSDSEDKTKMYVGSADFALSAKAALKYYHTKEIGYDDLYLIGDDSQKEVGEFSTGASSQKNRAHFVELVSALAARDFFEHPFNPNVDKEYRYFIAGRKIETITWQNLPFTRDDNLITQEEKETLKCFRNMTTFVYAYLYGVLPIIRREEHKKIRATWYRENFVGGLFRKVDDCDISKFKNELDHIKEYCKRFLEWAIEINDEEKMALFNTSKLKVQPTDLDLESDAIGDLIKSEKAEGKKLSEFFAKADEIRIDNKIKNISRLVHLLYDASKRFCKDNYRS